jgi:hypothetical protein
MQEQVDALGVEFAEEVQQVDQRPTQAIDRPCSDHVDVAAGRSRPGRLSRPLAPEIPASSKNSRRASHGAPLGPAPKMPPPRRSAPAANAFNPAIESDGLGMPGERSNVKSRSRLDEPGRIDIKGRMSATPKQTFDVYRKRTNPTLRLAVAPGAGLPGQFASKDWTLVEEPSVLHSDVSEDVATKGYCYFQLVKG